MQVVMTRQIANKMNEDREFTEFIEQSLRRYFNRDWGDTCKEDWKMNDSALKNIEMIESLQIIMTYLLSQNMTARSPMNIN